MQRVAQARLAHTPGLMLWTTTGVLLQGEGPAAPIWLRAVPQSERSVQAGVCAGETPLVRFPEKAARNGTQMDPRLCGKPGDAQDASSPYAATRTPPTSITLAPSKRSRM